MLHPLRRLHVDSPVALLLVALLGVWLTGTCPCAMGEGADRHGAPATADGCDCDCLSVPRVEASLLRTADLLPAVRTAPERGPAGPAMPGGAGLPPSAAIDPIRPAAPSILRI